MNIAILSPKDPETAETFIKNHIEYLPFNKIVVYGGRFPYKTSSYKNTFALSKIRFVNKLKRLLGIKHTNLKESELTRILRENKIDLVFAEYLITGAEVYPVCSKLNIPLIVTALGYDVFQHDVINRYLKKYQGMFQYCKKVIVVSKHMINQLEKFGCSSDKIVFSPASPRKDFFELSPSFESKQILAVGRFVEKKAPHYTITAFSKVLKQCPDAILVMAGDGPLLDNCKELVSSLGIEDKVVFKGRITTEEHKALLLDSYMFVQHSITAKSGDSEGTPVAILEASAAGLPVVSTLHAGIPDIILQGETGYLVPEWDSDLMADKMLLLLENDLLAKKMGANGKTFVRKNFTLEKHIKIISECIID